MNITNTTTDSVSPMLVLIDGLSGGGGSGAIESMEKRGQTQLVNSDRLPTDTQGSDDAFIAAGFTFGEPEPGDLLFRPATLPAGWRREATDHSMHSNIVDPLGRKRVGIFYKAAYYDRRADMYLVSQHSYLTECLWNDHKPVLDNEWLPAVQAAEVLAQLKAKALEDAAEQDRLADERPAQRDFWADHAREKRELVQKIQQLIDHIGQTAN